MADAPWTKRLHVEEGDRSDRILSMEAIPNFRIMTESVMNLGEKLRTIISPTSSCIVSYLTARSVLTVDPGQVRMVGQHQVLGGERKTLQKYY